MVILGIDPGTADTGWGVIKIENSKEKIEKSGKKKAKKPKVAGYSSIKTDSGVLMQMRLKKLYIELGKIFKEFKPDVVVIERLFFNTNQKTAMSVGQARGVVLLLCAQHRCEVVEYTALQAKLELTGYGRADKKEMQKKVGEILGIKDKIRPDDAADGLAMALCYLSKQKLVKIKN